jgi:predicted nucleic acid-binding protein
MRLLVDLNVVLDVLLDRTPHAEMAAQLWGTVERGEVEGLIPAHGFTTVFYLASKHRDAKFAREVVGDLVRVFGVAPVDEAVVQRALALGWPDFEDAVCAAAAESAGCGLLVTRDPSGFPDAPVPVVDPATALALLGRGGPDRVSERPGDGAYGRRGVNRRARRKR